jgi:hypothetical protein
MSVETASLDTVMRDANTTRQRRTAEASGSQNPSAKSGFSDCDVCLSVSLVVGYGGTALRRGELQVSCQHNSESARNTYSSRIPRNTLKIKVDAASYSQLKQGVFAPLNLTEFGALPRIRDRVERAAAGKIT